MIILDQEKPSLDELIHFGVKGMKWGVRGARTQSKRYSNEHVNEDFQKFGKRGVGRINNRIKNGQTHDNAVKIERRNRTIKRVAAVTYGAFVAKNIIQQHGPSLASFLLTPAVNKRVAKNGAKAAANLLSDTHGVTSYKALNLAFNATKGIWE